MEHDYDEYYDTKVSRPYARSKVGFYFGGFIAFIGICDIIFTIVDMYVSQYNLAQSQTRVSHVYTWDENPFWPSYGKGFWVGLILLVTGILGFVSYLEETLTSIYAFTILSTVSSIFSFYQFITAIIPVATYNDIGSASLINQTYGNWYLNSLAFNAVLLAFGGLGCIVCAVAAGISSALVGCFIEKRGYGGEFVNNFYKSLPSNIPIPPYSLTQGSYPVASQFY